MLFHLSQPTFTAVSAAAIVRMWPPKAAYLVTKLVLLTNINKRGQITTTTTATIDLQMVSVFTPASTSADIVNLSGTQRRVQTKLRVSSLC